MPTGAFRAAERRQVLAPTTGQAIGGTVTAVMGASGSGKTSLLEAIAGRKSKSLVEGDVFASDAEFGRVGFVSQDDLAPVGTHVYAYVYTQDLRQMTVQRLCQKTITNMDRTASLFLVNMAPKGPCSDRCL